MYVLIEEYPYKAEKVEALLKDLNVLQNIEGNISLNYVGYFYSTQNKDCVFILPKVLLETKPNPNKSNQKHANGDQSKAEINKGVDEIDLVFGKYDPEDIIDLNSCKIEEKDRRFISEFAIWIYQTILVFKNHNTDSNIVYQKNILEFGRGARNKCNTFLEIVLALRNFNQENQNFFFFIFQNIKSGMNKINWHRTINFTTPIIQNNRPIYVDPINKTKRINYEEELIRIFFSILHYLNEQYGFNNKINFNVDLIKGQVFQNYLAGFGKRKLQQIKYRYFSDKAIALWDLCYAFFDHSKEIMLNVNHREYLLVKSFNIVFESIIDELIGEKELPTGLKDQYDGKIVDHLYLYDDLINQKPTGDHVQKVAKSLLEPVDPFKQIYYIGDSKYYKRNSTVGIQSITKQFTYARNVIQWDLNLFAESQNCSDDDFKQQRLKGTCLKDPITEGYNIIPNFFISAKLNQQLDFTEQLDLQDRGLDHYSNFHFIDRLFDRDSLLVCHFNVNFLHILSLYARNNSLQKSSWKNKVRAYFREHVKEMLEQFYEFYVICELPNTAPDDLTNFIEEHFKELNGKIFCPYRDHKYCLLALYNGEDQQRQKRGSQIEENNKEKIKERNDQVLFLIKQNFLIKKCEHIDDSPELLLEPCYEQFKQNYPLGVGKLLIIRTSRALSELELFIEQTDPESCLVLPLSYSKKLIEIAQQLNEINRIVIFNNAKEIVQLKNISLSLEEQLPQHQYVSLNDFNGSNANVFLVIGKKALTIEDMTKKEQTELIKSHYNDQEFYKDLENFNYKNNLSLSFNTIYEPFLLDIAYEAEL